MAFNKLCAPALIYIVFSISQIVIDSFKGLYNVALVKLFVAILFTILLNHLCESGLGIISWIIVFIPFLIMSLVSALLISMFGLNATTGMRKEEEVEDTSKTDEQIKNYQMMTDEEYLRKID